MDIIQDDSYGAITSHANSLQKAARKKAQCLLLPAMHFFQKRTVVANYSPTHGGSELLTHGGSELLTNVLSYMKADEVGSK